MNATYTVNHAYLGHVGFDNVAARAKKAGGVAKAVLAIAAAPLAGLAFVIALPFAGLAMLAWMHRAALKNTALFLAAPLIGLAYVVAFPFVGAGALVYFGVKALRN